MLKDVKRIQWNKTADHLVPCVVQDYYSSQVLMLGYMSEASLLKTLKIKKVTFYSRSKKRLWTKGETSKNFLHLIDWGYDCDYDAILIFAKADGPTCHTGTTSCFRMHQLPFWLTLSELKQTIAQRSKTMPNDSYTAKLFKSGVKRIAQKVGEEGVEVALAAMTNDADELINETCDLIYHTLVLLQAKKIDIMKISETLRKRMK